MSFIKKFKKNLKIDYLCMLKVTGDFSTDPDPLVGSASRIGPKMDLEHCLIQKLLNSKFLLRAACIEFLFAADL
jgi:hypothetical protein